MLTNQQNALCLQNFVDILRNLAEVPSGKVKTGEKRKGTARIGILANRSKQMHLGHQGKDLFVQITFSCKEQNVTFSFPLF
jgi:hypothetical protein